MEEKEEFYPDPYDEWHDNLIVEEYEKSEALQERIKNAIEWITNHVDIYTKNGEQIVDWNTLSDPRILLKILKGEDK